MSGRRLTEAHEHLSALRVDREKGIIYGVRILGSESKNTYGVAGVEATEYSAAAHADARRMYEGITANLNHIRDKGRERQVQDSFAVIKNPVTALEDGHPVTRGDLHCITAHEMTGRVMEDVEKKLGVFGLSHDAYSGKEHVDKGRKRLVIESMRKVVSVDLVIGAATNRNLWESVAYQPQTVRQVLEALTDLPPGKAAWRKQLLEDGGMGPPLSCGVDADAQLTEALQAAVASVLADSSMDFPAKKTKILALIEAIGNLTVAGDADMPDTPKTESVDAAEFAKLKAENVRLLEAEAKAAADKTLTETVRKLCESVKFTPSDVQLTALKGLPDDAQRKTLIESFRPEEKPRSGYTGRPVTESTEYKPATTVEEFNKRIGR